MAPTIFTDKKRQPRPGLRKINHHSIEIPASSSSRSLTAVSTLLSHVAKSTSAQRTLSTLRMRATPFHITNEDDGGTVSMNDGARELTTISGSTISSSSFLHNNNNINNNNNSNNNDITTDSDEYRSIASVSSTHSSLSPMPSDSRASNQSNTVHQYSKKRSSMCDLSYESMSTDENDAEVDAIISAKQTELAGVNWNGSENDSDSDSTAHFKRSQRDKLCTYNDSRTVFNAPKLSDKQQQSTTYNSNKSPRHQFNNDKWELTYSELYDIKNTEGLLAIAIKTIKLVKRNQLLQRRLAELQVETSEFIQSVLANPENRQFRENMKEKKQKLDSN